MSKEIPRFSDGIRRIKRAKFLDSNLSYGKQSAQYPQNCCVVEEGLKVPQVGIIKASIHRLFDGELKTVTISKTPTGKYYASLLFDTEQKYPEVVITGKVIGIDLAIKDFAITNDSQKTSKYPNPRHLKKHERKLAKKQTKLARKQRKRKG